MVKEEDIVCLRYAHEKGHTYISFNDRGNLFATAGSEGFVHVWKHKEDTDPKLLDLGSLVSALAIKDDLLYLGHENRVKAYTLPGLEFDSIVMDFSTAVYCIACDKLGQYIAAGGSDFIIKAQDKSDKSLAAYRGHEGPILSLAFDPQRKYLASSSCDGTVKLWQMSTQECFKTLRVLPKTNDRSETSSRCCIDWSVDGEWLAVPVGKKVDLYARDTFKLVRTFTDDCIKEDLSIVAFSASGVHVCTTDLQGLLVVWLLEKDQFRPIVRWQHPKKVAISSLTWHPRLRWVSFIDVEGEMGQYQMLSLPEKDLPPTQKTESKLVSGDESVEAESVMEDKSAAKDKPAVIEDEAELLEARITQESKDIEDDFWGFNDKSKTKDESISRNKDVNGFKDKSKGKNGAKITKDDFLDFEAKDDDFMDFEAKDDFEVKDDESMEGNEENGAFDIGAIKASWEPFMREHSEEKEEEKEENVAAPPPVVVQAPRPPVQTSFQPGSSPISLERRFMVWNSTGVVRCYNTEQESSIEVEFHDAGVHHPLQLTNHAGHTLAALSPRALLLAAPPSQEKLGKVECTNFGCWGARNEWTVDLLEEEEVEGLCCSELFGACVTSGQLLRIFSVTGVQGEVIALPGPPVACAAHGLRLIVAHHNGQGVEDGQCLSLMVVKIELGGHCKVKQLPLPISPKAFLTWLGFSDEGSPCVVDTAGRVSILSSRSEPKWVPVADTRANLKSKSDTRFVVGLSEAKQQVRYILCKGSRYPNLLPRPTVSVLDFSLPFWDTNSDRGKFEEEIRRCVLQKECLKQQNMIEEMLDLDKKLLSVYLKMFALSVHGDRESRAREIHAMMPTQQLQQAAVKYAAKSGFTSLAKRLGEEMARRLNDNPDTSSSEEEEEPTAPPPPPPKSSVSQPTVQPKTFSMQRHRKIVKPIVASESNLNANLARLSSPATSDKPRLPPSETVKVNPFKSSPVSSSPRQEELKIDNVLSSSMEGLKPPAESNKPSRFASLKQNEDKPTGFPLYLSTNKALVKREAPPGATEAEIMQLAIKMYRKLPKEEKQKYAEGGSSPKTTTPKRKEEEVGGDEPSKKPKTSQPSTLTRFAFTKTPK